MFKAAQRPRFRLEAIKEMLASRMRGKNQLQCKSPLKTKVPYAVNNAHSTAA
jgi:hypothetical protein